MRSATTRLSAAAGRIAALILVTLALTPCSSALGNLVQNPGFETGWDFSSWTLSGTGNAHVVGYNVHSERHAGEFGWPGGPPVSYLSQDLTTVVGGIYTLSFWLRHDPSGTSNQFAVSWDGVDIIPLRMFNAGDFDYMQFTVSLLAADATTTLQFSFRQDDPAPYYNAAWYLDDVSVEPSQSVPESGSTLLVLGIALAGLEGLRRILAVA